MTLSFNSETINKIVKKHLSLFIHSHNSCLRNRDYHIFTIMTGNAHKESCHKLLLVLVREQG